MRISYISFEEHQFIVPVKLTLKMTLCWDLSSTCS